jgi:hypothetical protein
VSYISKSEREAASRMTWTEIIAHVTEAERCDENEARRQIGNAIADRMLHLWWEDQGEIPFGSGPLQVRVSTPPRDAAYWLKCEIDPTDPDRVHELPSYDSDLVDKRTAKRLEKTRRFRKPLFQHDEALKLWPSMPESGQSPSENVVNFPRGSRGRPSERNSVYRTLAQMRRDGVSLNKPQKTLAEEVASRNGVKLGDRGWVDRTIVQHVSDWLRENPDPLKR